MNKKNKLGSYFTCRYLIMLIKKQTYDFYQNLIHYQPKLNLDTIKYHIDFFLDYDIEKQTK